MSEPDGATDAFWAALMGMTGLTPPVDAVKPLIEIASSFPTGVLATNEGLSLACRYQLA
ncbi:hypothetical protein ACI2KT_37075 [Ensifer adhaerens]|uniref:hypothetical protein n=1 Tax=Pseudomonadota TaxID=1224 RepID=UPI0038212AF0